MIDTILLIDDSDADLLYTQIIIERAGVARQVRGFESAREALAFLKQPESAGVGLILLDINMPGMNGFEFLHAYEQLRREQGTQAVVVMLTSSPDPQDQERAMAFASVRGYVTKPIDLAGASGLVQYDRGAGT
jgi:CheY-like chemotaxis protein